MAVAANADDYTNGRLNIFFPGVNPTLDGQCVSLVKWFMQEMSSVPNPQAARGNAKDVGRTLVAQGHAYEVPWAERRRGDIICMEYGTYGHIYVQLSGGRVFESNVNWTGVNSKIIDGDRVYASRIGHESEAWRANKNSHVYRLRTYSEGNGNAVMDSESAKELWRAILHREPENDQVWRGWVGKSYAEAARAFRSSPEWLGQNHAIVFFSQREQQLHDAQNALATANAQLKAALDNDAQDKKAIADALKKAQDAETNLAKVMEEFAKVKTDLDKEVSDKEYAVKTGNAFLRWLGEQLNKIGVK